MTCLRLCYKEVGVRVYLDRHDTVIRVYISDQMGPLILPVCGLAGERPVVGLQVLGARAQPDLDEAQRIFLVMIVFTVTNATTCCHELNGSFSDCFFCSHGIFMR